jgi:hypothetical protein
VDFVMGSALDALSRVRSKIDRGQRISSGKGQDHRFS